MRTMLSCAFAAGLGGAVVGGVFVLALAPRARPAPEDGGAARIGEAQSEEMGQLRGALADLASRLEAMELVPLAPRIPAASAAAAPAKVASEIPPPVAAGDDLRAAVAAVLREERDAERQREENRRAEQRAAQMDRRLDRLAQTLALAPEQKDALRKVFVEDEDRRREIGDRTARGETDWTDPGVREEMRNYVESRQQRIQGVLTPEQFEKYEESPEGRLSRVFAGPGFTGEGGGAVQRLFGGGGERRGRGQRREGEPPAPNRPQ